MNPFKLKGTSEAASDVHDKQCSTKTSEKVASLTSTKHGYNLPIFDGKITSWLTFWEQFKKIDQDEDLDDEVKFQYLSQTITQNTIIQETLELIRTDTTNKESKYQQAIHALKARYANNELLVEHHIRGLLDLVFLKEFTNTNEVVSNIHAHLQTLQYLDVTKKYAELINAMVAAAVPMEFLCTSRSQVDSIMDDDVIVNKFKILLKEKIKRKEKKLMGQSSNSQLKLHLLQLPLNVQLNIYKRLPRDDLRNLMATCSILRNMVIKDKHLLRREKIIVSWEPSPFLHFNQCRTSFNWSKGIYRDTILIQHQSNYMPWLKFHNSKSLIVSVGSELHAFPTDRRDVPICRDYSWKLEVPKVRTYDIRTNDISRFVIKDFVVVCGNRDGSIAVYSTYSKNIGIKEKPVLIAHIKDLHVNRKEEVSAVDAIGAGSIVFSGSSKTPTVRYFSGEFFLPNTGGVRCLAVNDLENKLAVGTNGCSNPALIDIPTGNLLLQSDKLSPKEAVRDLVWHDNNIVTYVSHSGLLKSLDIRSAKVVYNTRDPFQSALYCVKTDGYHNIVAGSAEYSRCVLFDARKCNTHVQMYFTQKRASPIYSLDFDSRTLITAADAGVACLTFSSSNTAAKDYSPNILEIFHC